MIRSKRTKITKAGNQLKQVVAEKCKPINFRDSKRDESLITTSTARFKKAKNNRNHLGVYQKQRNQSKPLMTIKRAGWKQQVPRHRQEIDHCRNFRIALFDIALEPEWDKHLLSYKTINNGKKRLPHPKFGASKFSSYKIELQNKSCSTVMEVIEKHQNSNNQKKSNHATSLHVPLGKTASDWYKFSRPFPSNRDQVIENNFIIGEMGEQYPTEKSFEIIPTNEISHCLNEEENNHSIGTLLMIEHNYALNKSKSVSFKISAVKSTEKVYHVNGMKINESIETVKNKFSHSVRNEHNYNMEDLHSQNDSHLNNNEFAGICQLPSEEKHVTNEIECSLSEYGSYLKKNESHDADNQFMESISTMVQSIEEEKSQNEKGNTMITMFTNTANTLDDKLSFTLNDEPTEKLNSQLVEFDRISRGKIEERLIDKMVDKSVYTTNLRSPVDENEDCSLSENLSVKNLVSASTNSTIEFIANVSSQEFPSCSKNSIRRGAEPIEFSQTPILNKLKISTQSVSGTTTTKSMVPEVQKQVSRNDDGISIQNALPDTLPCKIISTSIIKSPEKPVQSFNAIFLKRKRKNDISFKNLKTKKTEKGGLPILNNLPLKNKFNPKVDDISVKLSKTSLVERIMVKLKDGTSKNFTLIKDKRTGLQKCLSHINHKDGEVSVENFDVITASKVRSIENISIEENTTSDGNTLNSIDNYHLNKCNVLEESSSSVDTFVHQRDITNVGSELDCERTIDADYAPTTDDCHACNEEIDNKQPINGGISQIKITNVISRNNSYLNHFGDMKIVPKSDNRAEFKKKNLCQTIVAKPVLIDDPVSNYFKDSDLSSNQELIEPENFELKKSTQNRKSNNLRKSKYKLIDTLSRSSNQLDKNCATDLLGTFPESNSSKLEDIILQIIKDLDPQSIETAINLPDANSNNNYCLKNSGIEKESQIFEAQSETSIQEFPFVDNEYIIDALKVQNSAEEPQETFADPLPFIPTNCAPTNIPALSENNILASIDEKNEQYNSSRLSATSDDYTFKGSEQKGVDEQMPNQQTVLAQKNISDVKEMNEVMKTKNTVKKLRNPWHGWGEITTPVKKMSASCLPEPGKLFDVDLLSNQELKSNSTATKRSSEKLPFLDQLRWVHTDHDYVQLESPNLLEEAVHPLVAEVLMQTSRQTPSPLLRPISSISSQNPELVQNEQIPPNDNENDNDNVCMVEDDESDEMTICNHDVTSEESADVPKLKEMDPVICWKCGVASKCERMFGMHFTSLHLDSSVLQCLYCPKEFKHEESDAFEQHYVEHLRKKEADTRKRTMQNVCKSKDDNLGAYMKVFSKEGYIFCCLECNHQTNSYQAIEVHLQDVHQVASRKKNIFCDHCGSHFSSGVGKRLHSLSKHRDKMCRCNYCYWLYSGKASYYIHLRSCPVRKIKDDKELPELQRQVKMDLWWMKTSVDSENWVFNHDEIMSKERQMVAKQRLSLAYT